MTPDLIETTARALFRNAADKLGYTSFEWDDERVSNSGTRARFLLDATKLLATIEPLIRAQIQSEWADYIDHTTGTVGNTLTPETLAQALRAPTPPFGISKGTTP